MDLNCASSFRKHYTTVVVIVIAAVAACIASMRTLVCHLFILSSCAMCIQHVVCITQHTYQTHGGDDDDSSNSGNHVLFQHFVYIALFR